MVSVAGEGDGIFLTAQEAEKNEQHSAHQRTCMAFWEFKILPNRSDYPSLQVAWPNEGESPRACVTVEVCRGGATNP